MEKLISCMVVVGRFCEWYFHNFISPLKRFVTRNKLLLKPLLLLENVPWHFDDGNETQLHLSYLFVQKYD